MPIQGETFRGKFMPKNPDDFHPKALEKVGEECMWIYNRPIKKGEWSIEGFEGEWMVIPEASAKMPFQWTFERDVEKIDD